jgi:hypothetical protein
VKKISGQSLRNVQAVVTYRDRAGNFITSDDALIEYNPILAGQTSPFKVLTTQNPEMRTAFIEFKELMGGTIAYVDSTSKRRRPWRPPQAAAYARSVRPQRHARGPVSVNSRLPSCSCSFLLLLSKQLVSHSTSNRTVSRLTFGF